MENLVLVAVSLFVEYNLPESFYWYVVAEEEGIRVFKSVPRALQLEITKAYFEKTGYKLIFTS